MTQFTKLQQAWFSIMHHTKIGTDFPLKEYPEDTNRFDITIPLKPGMYAVVSCSSNAEDTISVLVETYYGRDILATNKHILGQRGNIPTVKALVTVKEVGRDIHQHLMRYLHHLLDDAYSILAQTSDAEPAPAEPVMASKSTQVKHAIERLTKALAGANLTAQLPVNVKFESDINTTLDTVVWLDGDSSRCSDTTYSIRRNGVEFHIMSSDGCVDLSLNIIKNSSDLTAVYTAASDLFAVYTQQ